MYVPSNVLSCFSRAQLFEILWTLAYQTPMSLGFFRQEYLSGLLCSPVWDLPSPGTEPVSLTSPALASRFFTTHVTWEAAIVRVRAVNMTLVPCLSQAPNSLEPF